MKIDKVLPILMMAVLPIDVVVGVVKMAFPTQITIMAAISLMLGWQTMRRLAAMPQTTAPVLATTDEEQRVIAANNKANTILGAAFVLVSLFLMVAGLVGEIGGRAALAEFDNFTPRRIGELVILLLFNVLIAGLEALGARIFVSRK